MARVSRLVAILALLAPLAPAQTSEPAWPPSVITSEAPALRLDHLTQADGLAQGDVYDVVQDREGFVWIATQGGLHRYDGYDVDVHKTTSFDTTSLSSSWVSAVAEGPDGALWAATATHGLNRLDPATGAAVHFRHDEDDETTLSSDHLGDVLVDQRGDVWAATHDAGLNRLRAGADRFERFREDKEDPATLTSDRVGRLSEGPDGTIWAGTANGVSRIDPASGAVTRYLHDADAGTDYGQAPGVMEAFHPPGQPGIVWLTTSWGLVQLDLATGEAERFLPEPDAPRATRANAFHAIAADPSVPGVLWLGSPDFGLARFDTRTERFTRYRHDPTDPDGLASDKVASLFADRSGMMWVGYNLDGLSRFNPAAGAFVHVRHAPDDAQSLAPGFVWGLYEDRAGALWVNTIADRSLLTRFDASGRVTRYRADTGNGRPGQRVNAFAEDGEGRLWLGGFGGLARFDAGTDRLTAVRHAADDREREHNLVLAVRPTAADSSAFWLGTGAGLTRFDARTEAFTRVPLVGDGSEDPAVRVVWEDAEGVVWAGSVDGLFRVAPDGTARLVSAYDPTDRTTISSNVMLAIHERPSEPGVLWLGTQGGGLSRFDTATGTASHLTTADGLPDDVVYGILEDARGALWLSTNHGLARVDPETGAVEAFGLDDGLMALEYNMAAFAEGAGGVLYFGSGEGVTAFVPERLRRNTTPPQVALTGLQIHNEPVSVGPGSPLPQPLAATDEIRLAHHQDEVAFDFVALHYQNPEANRYAYHLDGLGSGWVEAGADRSATFTNLDPGTYTFRVRAANADGVWSDSSTAVRLVIAPPWWETGWAYGLYALALALGVVGVDRVQRRRLLAREREQARERELAHAREIEQAYDELRTTKDRLVQSEKMASLGALTAGIAHEIKNPLNFVTGFAAASQELVAELEDAPPDERAEILDDLRENAARIEEHGRRADAIVRSMMAHARSGTGERRAVDLNDFVEDYVGLAWHGKRAQDLAAEADVVRDYGPDAGAVALVPEEMGRVVINVVGNALDAVAERAATEGDGYAPTVTVSTRATPDGVEIRVADNGPGMAPEVAARVFEPFFTTKPTGEGTGLGLSLSHDIVAQGHGGTLAVETDEGEGATFVLTLPAATEASDAA